MLGSQDPARCRFLIEMSKRVVTGRRREARISVFLSYAHRDERLREELSKHLSPLRRSALIETWDDRKIRPGTDLDSAIDERLAQADVVLLLISPDFINSDYCYRREMRLALRRHAKGDARIIPIILRPVDWVGTPIGRLLAVPRDAKPVTTWHRRDDALLDVATSVRRAAGEMFAERTNARRLTKRSSFLAEGKRIPAVQSSPSRRKSKPEAVKS
jgi:TIR domain